MRDIKKWVVRQHDAYVTDGHNDYYGANDYKTSSSGNEVLVEVIPA
ncbi:MAG TPA: hypothetical protein DCF33_03545 [Saprospirales bacterium]|nr:hypothetical protein [Saprospirales bacterium]